MYTVNEVAERLKVSPATIYDAASSGELPHHRIGRGRGTIRVSEEQLAEYLKKTQVKPASSPQRDLRHIQLPS